MITVDYYSLIGEILHLVLWVSFISSIILVFVVMEYNSARRRGAYHEKRASRLRAVVFPYFPLSLVLCVVSLILIIIHDNVIYNPM